MKLAFRFLIVYVCCAYGNSVEILSCPKECVCQDSTITCAAQIPAVLPINTTAVHIKDFIRHDLFPQYFNHISWRDVQLLSIKEKHHELDRSHTWVVIHKAFSNLARLVHLKCSCPNLDDLQKEALYGLNNLEILDLAGSKQLAIGALEKALVGSKSDARFTPVPRLQYLDLTDVGIGKVHPQNLTENFRMALENKPIRTLNISGTRIGCLYFDAFKEALPVVHTLNISRMEISVPARLEFIVDKNWTTLRVFDISAIDYAIMIRQNTRFSGNMTIPRYLPVFDYLEGLILNDIAPGAHIFNQQVTYIPLEWSQRCRLKSVQLANNGLKWLNISIASGHVCPDVEILNLGRNNMQYISGDIFSSIAKLRILRLSDNQLQSMNKYEEFSKLFQNNPRLCEIYLSRNSFLSLPDNLFQKNSRLRIIDLSFNKLPAVSLNISHLHYLRLLDLRNNHITTLPERFILTLNTLFQGQADEILNKKFSIEIIFSDNPLLCSCNTKDAIVFFLENNLTSDVTCVLGGEVVKINQEVRSRIEFLCIQVATIVSMCALAVVVIILFTILSVWIYRRIQMYKMDQRIRKLTERYRNQQPNRFMAYLAFCQKDDKFVFDNIHEALEQRLREKLKFYDDRTLVCVADLHFKAGHYIEDQIAKAIDASRVVIFVISRAFCKSDWCHFEARVSYTEKKPILLMFLEDVPTKELPSVFRYQFNAFTRIKWKIGDGEPLLCPGWDSLCDFILENHQVDTNV